MSFYQSVQFCGILWSFIEKKHQVFLTLIFVWGPILKIGRSDPIPFESSLPDSIQAWFFLLFLFWVDQQTWTLLPSLLSSLNPHAETKCKRKLPHLTHALASILRVTGIISINIVFTFSHFQLVASFSFPPRLFLLTKLSLSSNSSSLFLQILSSQHISTNRKIEQIDTWQSHFFPSWQAKKTEQVCFHLYDTDAGNKSKKKRRSLSDEAPEIELSAKQVTRRRSLPTFNYSWKTNPERCSASSPVYGPREK